MLDNYKDVIKHLIPALDRYVMYGILPGGFLTACLENDFMKAVGRADAVNIHLLPEIACYIYNDMPGACHGSPERVQTWLEARRVEMRKMHPNPPCREGNEL